MILKVIIDSDAACLIKIFDTELCGTNTLASFNIWTKNVKR